MKSLTTHAYLSVVCFLAISTYWQCSAESRSHYFVNDKDASVPEGHFITQPEYHDCFIIVQETKRIGGQCVKIRDKIQGCVAGNLMQPLHHDCL